MFAIGPLVKIITLKITCNLYLFLNNMLQDFYKELKKFLKIELWAYGNRI